jgi:membrane protein DedA with SNARE-associated domain
VEKFLDDYGYVALLIGTFFEGETSILVASSLIYHGLFEMPYTIFFGFAGSFISDWLYFSIGRFNGRYFIEKHPALQARMAPVHHFFITHKYQILFTYRFLYGFRVIIPLIIGMSRIKPLQFLFYSIVSGLLWASVVSTVGYFFGRYLDIKTDIFEKNILYIVAGFATFGILLGYMIKRFAFKKITADHSVALPTDDHL